MSIEDVADRADVWEASLKRILKAVGAVGAALAGLVAGLMMLWPDGEVEKPKQQFHPLTGGNTIQIGDASVSLPIENKDCSSFLNTVNSKWSEEQWGVWEHLKREAGC